MATLKAVRPEVVEEGKPKFMISGKAGVGKTFFALAFPSAYYIDTEGGAVRKQYREKLITAGGAYMGKDQGSQDFNTVIDELKVLATTRHGYKTLIIDSFSHLYNLAAAIAEEKIGNDFGRDKKEANRPTRQLMRWIDNLDMNVILVCHQKDKWERKGKDIINSGTTFDGFDKMEFILDLWVEINKLGRERTFIVKKSRIDSLPEGLEMPLEYGKFAELYGKSIIEKPSEPIRMATAEHVAELNTLLSVINVDKAETDKWLTKAKVDSFEEMTEEHIASCINFLKKKLAGLNGTAGKKVA